MTLSFAILLHITKTKFDLKLYKSKIKVNLLKSPIYKLLMFNSFNSNQMPGKSSNS